MVLVFCSVRIVNSMSVTLFFGAVSGMTCLDPPAQWPFVSGFPSLVSEVCYVDVLADAGFNMASVCRVGGCAEYILEGFMVFLKGDVVSSALHAARFVALPCCDLCGLTLGESCPCFQFVVLLLDAAMLELRVRVGAFLDVHELLIFWLAGRIQSKEGSKTLVFKGERYVNVFSHASCFESVFLRASVAFGVLQQLCRCIVKSLSAATQCAGAAVAIAIHYPLVCAFSKSSVRKGLDFAAAQVSGFWKGVCVRAAAAFIKALASRFVGFGLFSYLLFGILEDLVFLLWASWYEGEHVLGLRIQRAARIVEVTVRARQALSSV